TARTRSRVEERTETVAPGHRRRRDDPVQVEEGIADEERGTMILAQGACGKRKGIARGVEDRGVASRQRVAGLGSSRGGEEPADRDQQDQGARGQPHRSRHVRPRPAIDASHAQKFSFSPSATPASAIVSACARSAVISFFTATRPGAASTPSMARSNGGGSALAAATLASI